MLNPITTRLTQHRKEITRFLKFAVVGTIGAIVDFGTFNLLQTFTTLSIIGSNTISFTTAVLSNFIWNRYWTYPDSRSKPLRRQLVQFFVVNAAGWGINTGILLLLKGPCTTLLTNLGTALPLAMLADPLLVAALGKNFAKVIATGVVMFWNFFINRLWTYNDV